MATDPNKLNWRDRLKYYQSDPEAGRKELTRAQNQANLYKATGDNTALKAAQHWMNQVNTVLGNNNPNPAQQSNRLLQQVKERVSQPIQPFTYDAKSIKRDPLYTAGYESMQNDYQRATNRSIVDLGRRGIGNSQSAVTVTAANNQALARDANTKLMPQVIAQKYRQYMDRYDMQQDQNRDLLDLATTFDTRARNQIADRRYDDELKYNREQDRIALTGYLPDGTPTNETQQQRLQDAWDTINDIGYVPASLAQLVGVPAGTKTLDAEKTAIDRIRANASLTSANASSRNADTAASSTPFNQFMDAWRASGTAPYDFNLNGEVIKKGTPYYDPVAARDGGETPQVDPKESANNLTQAKQYVRDLTYDQAIQYAQGIQDYVSDTDYRSLLNYIDNEFN